MGCEWRGAPGRRPGDVIGNGSGASGPTGRLLRPVRRPPLPRAARVHCVVLEVGSKSEAIELEARAVSRLQQLGLARVLNVQVGKGKAR